MKELTRYCPICKEEYESKDALKPCPKGHTHYEMIAVADAEMKKRERKQSGRGQQTVFAEQYTKEQILTGLDNSSWGTGVVARKLGCTNATAKRKLIELEQMGLVKRELLGGEYIWTKVDLCNDCLEKLE